MTRSRFRLFFLVAAIGSAATIVLDVSSRQAMAASTVNLAPAGSTYSLGYVTNTTITLATDSTVVPLANSLGATPALTVAGLTPAVITAASASAIGWIPPSAGSSWLGPNSIGVANGVAGLSNSSNFVTGFNASNSAPQGLYYYTTTFTLTPGLYGVSGGEWASDNQGAAIYLNGINLGMTNPTQYTAFSPFNIPAVDFKTDGTTVNTLTFVVWNENYLPTHGSPQGIEIEGTITAIPEPSAIAVVMSGLPLVGLYWARHRRRRASV